MHIPLAEVIDHRDLLSPREAATLTLAIGREWERQRGRDANQALPDNSHIALTAGGAIVFTSSAHGQSAPAIARTLSALLGQLLGLDEEDAPRRHIPGGLLITIAGQLGPLDLPSSRDDGFIGALSRFADDDRALARIHARLMAARSASSAEGRTPATKVRRGPERRRQPPAVTALRRAVRDLERQTFEARAIARAHLIAPAERRKRSAAVAGVATALTLLAGAAGFVLANYGPARSEPVPVTARFEAQPAAEPTPAPHTQRVAAPQRKATASKSAVARTAPARRSASQPHRVFAGGARAITWASALPDQGRQ